MSPEEFESSIIYAPPIPDTVFEPLLTVEEAFEIAVASDLITTSFPKIDTACTTIKPYRDTITYSCPCCGTDYISDCIGFIPNCKNCGSRLLRLQE